MSELPTLLVFMSVGMLGMLGHFAKKRLRGEIQGSLFRYLFCDRPSATLLALLSFIAAGAALAGAGALNDLSVTSLVGLAFTTGYTVDSALNRGAPT